MPIAKRRVHCLMAFRRFQTHNGVPEGELGLTGLNSKEDYGTILPKYMKNRTQGRAECKYVRGKSTCTVHGCIQAVLLKHVCFVRA